jgi:molecular chaperone GrpE
MENELEQECCHECSGHEGQEKTSSDDQHEQALNACQTELSDCKENYKRLSADFQNFKKRLQKEQSSLQHMLQADVLLKILPVIDNFDRALQERPEQEAGCKAWLEGFELIRKELYAVLEYYGVKEIESTDEFNPEYHEAVMQVESDNHEPGDIVEVLQKGYMIGDRVLRPAKVSVAE